MQQLIKVTGRWRFLVALTIGCCGCGGAESSAPVSLVKSEPRVVSVAAAADLKFAFDEVLTEFGKKNPDITVKATYGSSGNFFAQLSNRAPFDIYLSADIDYPRKLIELGHAAQASEFQYAVGQIVIWVPNASPIDVEKLEIHSVTVPEVRKLAIANPKHAPYGRAAEAALQKLGVYEQVKDRLVFGENIAQTAQFVDNGAADMGIIALSLAMAPALRDKGRYWLMPIDSYPTLEQGGVILNWAKDREATESLRTFLIGDPGRSILKRYGFMLPGE